MHFSFPMTFFRPWNRLNRNWKSCSALIVTPPTLLPLKGNSSKWVWLFTGRRIYQGFHHYYNLHHKWQTAIMTICSFTVNFIKRYPSHHVEIIARKINMFQFQRKSCFLSRDQKDWCFQSTCFNTTPRRGDLAHYQRWWLCISTQLEQHVLSKNIIPRIVTCNTISLTRHFSRRCEMFGIFSPKFLAGSDFISDRTVSVGKKSN